MAITATFIHFNGYIETRELTRLYDEILEDAFIPIPAGESYIYEYHRPKLFVRDLDAWPPVFRQVEERPLKKLPKGVI